MTAIDGTGLHALEHLADTLHDTVPALLLCGMRDQPARMMQRAEFHQHIRHAAVGSRFAGNAACRAERERNPAEAPMPSMVITSDQRPEAESPPA